MHGFVDDGGLPGPLGWAWQRFRRRVFGEKPECDIHGCDGAAAYGVVFPKHNKPDYVCGGHADHMSVAALRELKLSDREGGWP